MHIIMMTNRPYHIIKPFLPSFDKCIEIMNTYGSRNKMMDIKIRNDCSRRNKNTTNDFQDHKISCAIQERDLFIIR
jgi:hypothetical protein